MSDLVLTGIIDGPLTGGIPKAVEFFALNDISDLSAYGFGSANNGGGSDGQEYTFSGSATAGDYIYIATETTGFNDFFGFAPDDTSAAASINGDDAIELFFNGSVVDIFGDINVDGSGQPWEYMDGWAYRVPGTEPDGATFNLDNWTFSGPNALDGTATNDTASMPFPFGSYDADGDSNWVINEVYASHTGTDDTEFIELFGTPGTSLEGLSLIVVEGDSGNFGEIDRQIDFDAGDIIGDNGFLLVGNPAGLGANYGVTPDLEIGNNFLENSSFTVALVETDSISGTSVAGSEIVLDTVALTDGGAGDTFFFDAPVIGPDGSFFPAGARRVTDGVDTDTVDDWAIGDFLLGSENTPTAGTFDNGGGEEPAILTFIHEVQGDGASSPLKGETVTVEAVVVGDFQDGESDANGDLNGFFIQEEDSDADNDPLTSEGMFIFDGSSPAVDVNIGDVVEVTGTVGEFFGMTQLSDVSVTVQGTDSLPTPAIVNLPAADSTTNSDGDFIADLEQFEGMGVTIPDTLFVTEYFNLDRFGEVVLSSDGPSNEPGTDGRLDQYTDFNEPDVEGFAAYQAEIGKRRIVVDDGLTVQNPDPILLGRGGNPLSATNILRGGDTVENLSGVLNFSFDEYRVQPIAPVDFQPTNSRPETPEDVGGDLTVASLNVLNFFTTLDVEGNPGSGPNNLSPRGADSQAEFDRQIEKLVTNLEAMDADIVGLVELENEFGDQNGDGQFAIDTLVNALNDRVGAGTYAYVDPGVPFVDTGDAISVGAIYKTDTVRVAPGTTVEVLTDSDLPELGLGGTVFDGPDTNRAPIAVTFEELGTGEVFTIAVNHFKSKGGTGSGDDADIGDGQGNFNGTRLRGAEALNAWLETDPTGSGDGDFLIVGDLNAYAQEDPITFLEGEGYADLIEEFVGDDAYSFVFDGQFGYLDYALANESLAPQVTGTTEWSINADEPDAFDYNLDFGRNPDLFDGSTPFRSSDHDPVIVGLDLSTPFNEIEGTEGNDKLEGTPENDAIAALGGDDIVAGNLGDDRIDGGDGNDVLRGDLNRRSPQIGVGGDDTISGGNGNDRIGGKAGNDVLFGDAGNDSIWGDDGDDLIRGGGGDDVLTGDDFSGGSGSDTFILAAGEGTDTIVDFEVGIDFIGLADGLTFDDLSFSGNTISFDGEVLANLSGVNVTTLTAEDFSWV